MYKFLAVKEKAEPSLPAKTVIKKNKRKPRKN